MLALGRRTVASALRVMGYADETNPSKSHRVLSWARWSPMQMSRLLLDLLVETFVPEGATLTLLVDETLERRAGKKIGYKGYFREGGRALGKHVAISLGIRWRCLCLLVSVPWAKRPWALPFLRVPVLSEKTCNRLKKPHRSGIDLFSCRGNQRVKAGFAQGRCDSLAVHHNCIASYNFQQTKDGQANYLPTRGRARGSQPRRRRALDMFMSFCS